MKKLLLLCLGLAVSLAAQAGPRIEHWVAPSGARVYFVESHVLPIVDLQVDFAAGGAYVPAGKSGLAGLTRSLMEAGAANLDEEHIAERLVDLGAQLDGSADLDRASFRLRTLASAKERDGSVELLATVLSHPTFPADVLERERARAIAGIREAETKPESILLRAFSAALYPGHPYGVTPTVESVSAVTRDDLVSFYQGRFGARRAAVTLVGDLTRAEAERIAQQLTAGLPDSPPDEGIPTVVLPQAQTVRLPHPAQQSHIAIGMPALSRGDPDFFALQVGNYVLGGGGFVSRLTKEVREQRGYAYSVYSYFMTQRALGPFQVGLQTKRAQAQDALAVVNDTLSRFLAEGPTAAEVAAAKRNLVDGFALKLDSNRKLTDFVALIGFFGLPLDYIDTYQKNIAAVTPAQVRAAFQRKVQAEHLVTVIVAGDNGAAAPGQAPGGR